jgi:RHS repeat-associated protein
VTVGSARALLSHPGTHRRARAHSARNRRTVQAHAASSTTYSETTGGEAHTWTNYTNAGGEEGPLIAEYETVQISCRVKGFKVKDGDEWWYLVASSPWNSGYFVSADPFYNNGQTSGTLIGTPLVDEEVPECGAGEGTPETTGGETHTWSNYGDAGGTKGTTIGGQATVHVACKVLGLSVADGNNWWYRISQIPWNNAFYASADAFYNNGATSGSLAGTPFVDESVPTCPEPSEAGATAETAGGEAHTWTNYADAGGTEGQTVEAHQIIQVECKLQGFAVADGNTWWYRIKQAPWSGGYYVSADAFYNGAPATGSLIGTPYVDGRVPTCPSGLRPGEEMTGGEAHTFANYSHAGAAQGPTIPTSSAVAVSCRVQGWAAPDGNTWWYLVASAPWNNVFYVSADAFYNGAPPTGNLKGTPFVDPSIPVCVGNHEAPIASAVGSGHGVSNQPGCKVADPVDCASGDFTQTFTDVSISGRGAGLQAARTYNSLNAATTGLFGYGWSSTLGQSLTSTERGTALITLDDGSLITATPDGSGGYAIPASADATLQHNSDGTYTLTEHATQRLTFSSAGKLLSISDLNGSATTLSYTGTQLTTVTDASGRTLTVTLDASGRISTLTDPLGRRTIYEYDGAGNLATVTDPAGRAWHFKYDDAHRLTQMTDPRGGTVHNEYDAESRVIAQTDPAGLITRFTYTGENFSPLGGTTTDTDPHGNSTIEQYDNGFLMQITKAVGTTEQATSTYAYDPSTLGITTETDANGHSSHTTYNTTGQPTSTTDALGKTTTYTYNQLQEVLTTTTSLEETTTRTYDASGNLTSTTDAEAATTHYEHGNSSHPGDVTAIVDPEGRTETLTYDANGNVATRSRHPHEGTSATTAYIYDADSELSCEASANATAAGIACASTGPRVPGTATNSYDADGELTMSTDAAGHTRTYEYNADGNLMEAVDPHGNRTVTSYDADSRVASKTTAFGAAVASTIEHTYDLPARTSPCQGISDASYCEITTDPNGGRTIDYHDARNELIATTRPGGRTTRYTYDSAGNRVTLTDAEGRITAYRYDAANRQTQIVYSDGATPNVERGYDVNGNRTAMSDGTGTISYQYDKDGRLTKLTDGSGASTSYAYDKASLVTKITYPNGKAISRSYDGADRLEAITDWLGHTTTFGYDASGNLSTTGYPDGDTVTSSYSATNALVATAALNSAHKALASIAYARNENELISNETTKKITSTGPVSYDAANRLAGTASTGYEYDPAGNPKSFAGTTLHYNNEDELTGASNGNAYTYDAEGDRSSSNTPAGPDVRYRYDQAARLIETVGVNAPSVKSIKPTTGPFSGGTTVTIKGEHLESASSVSFGGVAATSFHVASAKSITAVSPAGTGTVDVQVTTSSATSAPVAGDRFTYSGATGHAVRAAKAAPALPSTSYAYNGDGLRSSQTTESTTVRYTWDITTPVPEIMSDTTNSYIYGPQGLPIEQVGPGDTPSYFFHDAIGSTRALLGSTGALAATFNYGAFGATTKGTGTARTPIRFAGGYVDETTGLIYLVHRYYDPTSGLFLTVDPALGVTAKPYSYAGDDPINQIDPTGMFLVNATGCLAGRCGSYDNGNGLGGGAGYGFSITIGSFQFSDGATLIYYPSTGITSVSGGDYGAGGSIDFNRQGQVVGGSGCLGLYLAFCANPSGSGGSLPAVPSPVPGWERDHEIWMNQFFTTSRSKNATVASRCGGHYSA